MNKNKGDSNSFKWNEMIQRMDEEEKLTRNSLADKFTKARRLAAISERDRLMTLLRKFQTNKYELAEKESNEKYLEQAQFLNEVMEYLTSVDDECKNCKRLKSGSCFGVPNRNREEITLENSCSGFLEE